MVRFGPCGPIYILQTPIGGSHPVPCLLYPDSRETGYSNVLGWTMTCLDSRPSRSLVNLEIIIIIVIALTVIQHQCHRCHFHDDQLVKVRWVGLFSDTLATHIHHMSSPWWWWRWWWQGGNYDYDDGDDVDDDGDDAWDGDDSTNDEENISWIVDKYQLLTQRGRFLELSREKLWNRSWLGKKVTSYVTSR